LPAYFRAIKEEEHINKFILLTVSSTGVIQAVCHPFLRGLYGRRWTTDVRFLCVCNCENLNLFVLYFLLLESFL